MIKKVFVSSTLILSSFLSAQLDFSSARFGIIGGYNYSRVKNAHNPSGPRHTFQFGGLAEIPFTRTYDQFYLQPELEYYGAGESGRDARYKDRPGYDATYYNNYISMPIYFKAYFSEVENQFFCLAGPRLNFKISQKVQDNSKQIYDVDSFGKARTFDIALSGGIGYSYRRKAEIAVKADVGLLNTYPKLKKGGEFEAVKDPDILKNKNQYVLSATLSYIFD